MSRRAYCPNDGRFVRDVIAVVGGFGCEEHIAAAGRGRISMDGGDRKPPPRGGPKGSRAISGHQGLGGYGLQGSKGRAYKGELVGPGRTG